MDDELKTLPIDLHETTNELKKKTNQKTEYERKHILDLKDSALFQQEFFRADREAYDFLDLSVDEMEKQKSEDWPYLAASIGNDYSFEKKGYVETLIEAARLINEKSYEMEKMLTRTRQERKDTIGKIEKAKSREEAVKAYIEYLPQYTDRLR